MVQIQNAKKNFTSEFYFNFNLKKIPISQSDCSHQNLVFLTFWRILGTIDFFAGIHMLHSSSGEALIRS